MEPRLKVPIQPLHPNTSNLFSGKIVKLTSKNELFIADQWKNIYPIDMQSQLISKLNEADEVVFCHLDNRRTVVLNRLVSPLAAETSEYELTLPGISEGFVRINDQGVHLQIGKASVLISTDGSIKFDAQQLEHVAKESLRFKGGMIHIN